ncbi:Hsp70 family protein, partial [Bordetella pertussis]|uniref:Hsp70 family protein n=1 Tax=Bordetella pertussis TaxID=520 RepID=UPI0021BDE297
MALLQISEPGDSPAPHQRKLAVGIDLGTTNSLVAAVRSSVPEVLADAQGQVLLPSAVRYLDGGAVRIGREALLEQARDPLNTIVSVKRFMGRSAADAAASGAPYEFVDAPGMVRLRTVQGDLSPVEVSAQILAVLRQRAEDVLGDDLVGAVITVPAYFDDAQRQATRDAARLAGLNVLRLLNEPTAAAIAYGLDQAAEGIYAVYDLGGGTFDISILRLTQGVFEVIATGGDTALGGDDFDSAIVAHACAGEDVAALPVADRRALLVAARAAREALTDQAQAPFEVTLRDGRAIQATLTRAQFEQLAEPLTNLDPDQVVALGAALQANLLA